MKRRHRIFAAALLGYSLLTAPALAWDNFGHMAVAAVAWEKMTDPAKARAMVLLRLNPNFDKFVDADAPAAKQDKYAFMTAATWPDMIKSMPDYHSDGSHNGDIPPPDKVAAGQNIGYADKARHKYWHFIDVPLPIGGAAGQPPLEPNAQTQIAKLRDALPANSPASEDIRSYDLVWLEHLVGDVHQPLHATTRFTPDQPDGDAGGNEVKVHCGEVHRCGASELHAYWDDLLGPSKTTPEDVEEVADALRDADATAAAITDEKVWIKESSAAAKSTVYKAPIGDGEGPFNLTQRYDTKAKALADKRVALAGARLANMLNAAFK
jgi:hypothetical protein